MISSFFFSLTFSFSFFFVLVFIPFPSLSSQLDEGVDVHVACSLREQALHKCEHCCVGHVRVLKCVCACVCARFAESHRGTLREK